MRCQECGFNVNPNVEFCPNCGAHVSKPLAWQHVVMAILIIGTGICFILGWVAADSAVQQCAWFASGAVLGILARIAQAASQ